MHILESDELKNISCILRCSPNSSWFRESRYFRSINTCILFDGSLMNSGGKLSALYKIFTKTARDMR